MLSEGCYSGMRSSALCIGLLTGLISGAAYWADGSGPGATLLASAILGLAVFLTARIVDTLSAQLLVAFVYLASTALGAVAVFVIDKVAYGAAPTELLTGSLLIPGVLLGWAACEVLLRDRKSGRDLPTQSALT